MSESDWVETRAWNQIGIIKGVWKSNWARNIQVRGVRIACFISQWYQCMIWTILRPWNLLSLVIFAFLDFSRNRLAVGHEPPGGLCVFSLFSGFSYEPPGGWGWLASRQATQRASFYFFVLVGLSAMSWCLGCISIVHI